MVSEQSGHRGAVWRPSGRCIANDPAVQFCLQAARRNLGDFETAARGTPVLAAPTGRPLGRAAARRSCGWPIAPACRPKPVALLPADRDAAVPRWRSPTTSAGRAGNGRSAERRRRTRQRSTRPRSAWPTTRTSCTSPSTAHPADGYVCRSRRGRATPTCAATIGSACCSISTATIRPASTCRSISAAASATTAGATDMGPTLVRVRPRATDGLWIGGSHPAGRADGRLGHVRAGRGRSTWCACCPVAACRRGRCRPTSSPNPKAWVCSSSCRSRTDRRTRSDKIRK